MRTIRILSNRTLVKAFLSLMSASMDRVRRAHVQVESGSKHIHFYSARGRSGRDAARATRGCALTSDLRRCRLALAARPSRPTGRLAPAHHPGRRPRSEIVSRLVRSSSRHSRAWHRGAWRCLAMRHHRAGPRHLPYSHLRRITRWWWRRRRPSISCPRPRHRPPARLDQCKPTTPAVLFPWAMA